MAQVNPENNNDVEIKTPKPTLTSRLCQKFLGALSVCLEGYCRTRTLVGGSGLLLCIRAVSELDSVWSIPGIGV